MVSFLAGCVCSSDGFCGHNMVIVVMSFVAGCGSGDGEFLL